MKIPVMTCCRCSSRRRAAVLLTVAQIFFAFSPFLALALNEEMHFKGIYPTTGLQNGVNLQPLQPPPSSCAPPLSIDAVRTHEQNVMPAEEHNAPIKNKNCKFLDEAYILRTTK